MQITLHNFQAHKHTVVDASENITAIVGKSHHGKTSILRGIKFFRFNKPLGDSFVRKGTKDCFVSIDGVQHVKDKQNYYNLGDGTDNLTALKGAVPAGVQNAANFSEVNLQMQFDPLFLLSASYSPGTVASILSELVDISGPQKILTYIRGKGKTLPAEHKALLLSIKETEAEIGKLQWVTDLSKQYAEISSRIAEFQTLSEKATTIGAVIENAVEAAKNLKNIPITAPLQTQAVKLLNTIQGIGKNLQEMNTLASNMDTIHTINGAIPQNCSKLIIKGKSVLIKIKENSTLAQEMEDLGDTCELVYDVKGVLTKSAKAETLRLALQSIEKSLLGIGQVDDSLQSIKSTSTLLTSIKNKEEITRKALAVLKEKIGVCPLCGGNLNA